MTASDDILHLHRQQIAAAGMYDAAREAAISSGCFMLGVPDVGAALRKQAYATAWRSVLERTPLRDILSSTDWRDMTRGIDRHELPEPSEEAFASVLAGMQDQAGDLFRRSLIGVLRQLTRATRNRGHMMTQRMIIGSVWHTSGYLASEQARILDDLSRCLAVVARRRHTTTDGGWTARWTRGETEDEYISISLKKNGNVHVFVKDQQLVEWANQLLGKDRELFA